MTSEAKTPDTGLDDLLIRHFPGKVVRKDLTKLVKDEIELAKAEMMVKAKSLVAGAVAAGVGVAALWLSAASGGRPAARFPAVGRGPRCSS